MRQFGPFGQCEAHVHDDFGVGFHQCISSAKKTGYCGMHDPATIAKNKAKRTHCAYVDEDGEPVCSIAVHGTVYCRTHSDYVQRAWIYAQARAQQLTLKWLDKQLARAAISVGDVRRRLRVTMRNGISNRPNA